VRKALPNPSQKPVFFRSAAQFRRWLDKHHGSAAEVWVGLYKKASGKGGISYPEAVDQALCYGWIDGVRKRVDDDSYMQRFSPRRAASIWSAVNIKRVGELTRLGMMHASGAAVFKKRDRARAGLYSFENRPEALAPALERRFRANAKAWAFFEAQPPGYRRVMIFWIMSARQEPTRERRLALLIEASQEGRRHM
jgi:uncharacterized protein YdeI (YjbR/CyaY-like superfamily)